MKNMIAGITATRNHPEINSGYAGKIPRLRTLDDVRNAVPASAKPNKELTFRDILTGDTEPRN
jgi:hypothetical protein